MSLKGGFDMENVKNEEISNGSQKKSDAHAYAALIVEILAKILIEKTLFQSAEIQIPYETILNISNELIRLLRPEENTKIEVAKELVITYKQLRGIELTEAEKAYEAADKDIDVMGEVLNGLKYSTMGLLGKNLFSSLVATVKQGLYEHIPAVVGYTGAILLGPKAISAAVDSVLLYSSLNASQKQSIRPWLTTVGRLALGCIPKVHATDEGVHYHYPSVSGHTETYSKNLSVSMVGEDLTLKKPGKLHTPKGDYEAEYILQFKLHHIARLTDKSIRIQVLNQSGEKVPVEFYVNQGQYGQEIRVKSTDANLEALWTHYLQTHQQPLPAIAPVMQENTAQLAQVYQRVVPQNQLASYSSSLKVKGLNYYLGQVSNVMTYVMAAALSGRDRKTIFPMLIMASNIPATLGVVDQILSNNNIISSAFQLESDTLLGISIQEHYKNIIMCNPLYPASDTYFMTQSHSAKIWGPIVLPDGHLASASVDNTIQIWNAQTGECTRLLRGHTGDVNILRVMHDGSLVSASEDKTIRIWDARTGNCLLTLRGHTGAIRDLLVLPDRRLASSSEDQSIKIWDAKTGLCKRTLSGHTSWVTRLVILFNGSVASVSMDKTIKIWDTKTGLCLQSIKPNTFFINTLVALPNDRLATTNDDYDIEIFDVNTGISIQKLPGDTHYITKLILLPDGRLASTSRDVVIKIWDTITGSCVHTLHGHDYEVEDLTILSDGNLASVSRDNIIKIWDIRKGLCVHTHFGYLNDYGNIVSLPDGRLASVSRKYNIKIYDPIGKVVGLARSFLQQAEIKIINGTINLIWTNAQLLDNCANSMSLLSNRDKLGWLLSTMLNNSGEEWLIGADVNMKTIYISATTEDTLLMIYRVIYYLRASSKSECQKILDFQRDFLLGPTLLDMVEPSNMLVTGTGGGMSDIAGIIKYGMFNPSRRLASTQSSESDEINNNTCSI